MAFKFNFFKKKNNKVNYGDDNDIQNIVHDFEVSADAAGLNVEDLTAIKTKMTDDYSKIVVSAFKSEKEEDRIDSFNKIIEILENDSKFYYFPTHNNHEVAIAAANEVAGLGIFGRLYKNDPTITDMAWNGRFLTIKNSLGKVIYNGKDTLGQSLIYPEEVDRFIDIFAKADDTSFNASHPFYNGFKDDMRLSATHGSLTPDGNSTMAIRIARAKLDLNKDNFYQFAPNGIYTLLDEAVKARSNISLIGVTGTGKTSVQKLLVGSIDDTDRISNIADVNETHFEKIYPQKDTLNWLTKNDDINLTTDKKLGEVTISHHVSQSLRFDPDWIMVAEMRGKSAYDMYGSLISGHKIITTFHAIDNEAAPKRFLEMAMNHENCVSPGDIQNDFLRYMNLGLHLKSKRIDGVDRRYLAELAAFVEPSEEYPKGVKPIYRAKLHADLTMTCKTFKMPEEIIDLIEEELDDYNFVERLKSEQGLDFTENASEFTYDIKQEKAKLEGTK
ncbi:ATPase, T2SS/T4P/T4SS family [Apilactobacillus timberlakei]|uniref:ATPase, T2SS/T4P/T4SS family n=1 Tax=Apilactobacillus timberlakei TaxID=2008380 RepID=UPI001129D119|nr:ATPase, T2SS/T4P/T4SS family [Apilactobacillus timberlakei]TPR16738.1 hypothetical protein DYZ95_07090 [Apilactobacillus timberlakei]TPR21501.1 hypothetical protein DY083_05640 [Apilactobacillus timberlakei]